MKIGYDISKASRPRDGIGRYGRELLEALVALECDDEFLLYDLQHPLTEECLPGGLAALPENFTLRLGRPPRADALDLFHATSWRVPEGHAGVTLLTCYDVTFLTSPLHHEVENKLTCMRGMLEAIGSGAEFIAISAHTRDEMIRAFEIDAQRITVIHPGAGERFAGGEVGASRERVARRFGVDRPFILSVGTLEPRKNHLGLLAAYEALPAALREKVGLVIAGGEGWRNAAFIERLEAEGAPEGVHLLGYVEEDALIDLYTACEVFVFPSLDEGFGLPLLEALRCGAPAVASCVGALQEVAGDAALYVAPENEAEIADAIARLLESAPLRAELRAKIDVDEFTWDRAARRTLALYRRIVDR